jgi:hypothetical protein
MNIISSIFHHPDSATDRRQVDLLERALPEQVQRIRSAKNREAACCEIERLWTNLENIKSLTQVQIKSARAWLDIMLHTHAPSELAGLHFSGES